MADLTSSGIDPFGIEPLGADTQPGERKHPSSVPAPPAKTPAHPAPMPPIETEPEDSHELDELA